MIVDRTNRRLVLIITNALRAAAVVPLLLFGTSLTVVYLVNFLVATVTIFFVPAEAALLPKIVGKRYLMVANSLFTFTSMARSYRVHHPRADRREPIWLRGPVGHRLMFAAASILCATLPQAPPAQEHSPAACGDGRSADGHRDHGGVHTFGRRRSYWSLITSRSRYLVAVAGALAPGFVREVSRVGERNVVITWARRCGRDRGARAVNALGRRGRGRTRRHGTDRRGIGASIPRGGPAADGSVLTRGSPGLVARFRSSGMVAATASYSASLRWITVPSMTLLQEDCDEIRGAYLAS